jgi:hypothetical protein
MPLLGRTIIVMILVPTFVHCECVLADILMARNVTTIETVPGVIVG